MNFIFHPIDGLYTLFRSLATGLSKSQIAKYDADFIEMIKEGNVQFYGSSEELLRDIMGEDVCFDENKEVREENTCVV